LRVPKKSGQQADFGQDDAAAQDGAAAQANAATLLEIARNGSGARSKDLACGDGTYLAAQPRSQAMKAAATPAPACQANDAAAQRAAEIQEMKRLGVETEAAATVADEAAATEARERSARRAAERARAVRCWGGRKGCEPLGPLSVGFATIAGKGERLVDLQTMYPDAPKELLTAAADYSNIEDALDVIVDCLIRGVSDLVFASALDTADKLVQNQFDVSVERASQSVTSLLGPPASSSMTFERADRAVSVVHKFQVATMSQPTWCASCGGFLWGAREQGLCCAGCGTIVCSSCAATNASALCVARC
jgi:hypothetical protein